MRTVLLLACCAGGLIAGHALAQQDQFVSCVPFGGEVRVSPVGLPAQSAYSPRVGDIVYDNLSNVFSNGTGGIVLGINENCIDDCRFAPGPWENAARRLLTEITFGAAANTNNITSEQILVIFWNLNDLNFVGQSGANSPMLAGGAVPLAVLRIDIGARPPFLYHFTAPLTGLPGGGVVVPDGIPGVGVQIVWVTHGYIPTGNDYTNLLPNATGSTFSQCSSDSTRAMGFGSNSLAPAVSSTDPGTANAATVGRTSPSYGRDISNAAMCTTSGGSWATVPRR